VSIELSDDGFDDGCARCHMTPPDWHLQSAYIQVQGVEMWRVGLRSEKAVNLDQRLLLAEYLRETSPRRARRSKIVNY